MPGGNRSCSWCTASRSHLLRCLVRWAPCPHAQRGVTVAVAAPDAELVVGNRPDHGSHHGGVDRRHHQAGGLAFVAAAAQVGVTTLAGTATPREIGRASCRETVWLSVVGV